MSTRIQLEFLICSVFDLFLILTSSSPLPWLCSCLSILYFNLKFDCGVLVVFRPELVVKKLRYYARFIVVCLLLNKMDVVKDLVKVC